MHRIVAISKTFRHLSLILAICGLILMAWTVVGLADSPQRPAAPVAEKDAAAAVEAAQPSVGLPTLTVYKQFDRDTAGSMHGIPATPLVGETVIYTVLVENRGSGPATNVAISDTLPEGLRFVGPVTLEGSAGTVATSADDLPALASGMTVNVGERITVTFPALIIGAGEWVNVAGATCDEVTTPVTDDVGVEALHMHTYVDGELGTDALTYGGAPGAQAYRTIQYAADRIHRDGTIHVAAGTYDEHVILSYGMLRSEADPEERDSQVIIDGGGSGTVVTIMGGGALFGLTIQNGDIGVLVEPPMYDAPAPLQAELSELVGQAGLAFCNIISQTTWGVSNTLPLINAPAPSDIGGLGANVAAVNNWWGAADGPGGEGTGSGTRVSTYVTYDPWLGAPRTTSDYALVGVGSQLVDQRVETGIFISKTGSVGGALMTARYENNPAAKFTDDAGIYYDVWVSSNVEMLEQLTIRFYFTPEEMAARDLDTAAIQYWNGEAWVLCEPQSLHLGEVIVQGITYAGYIQVDVTADSTPSLGELTMTPFAISAEQELVVSLASGPETFCPGWSLYYTLLITNTFDAPLADVVVSDTLPAGVCCPADGAKTDVMMDWDEESGVATWQVGTIPAGETAKLDFTLHSMSSLSSGTVISNAVTVDAAGLDEPVVLEVGNTADDTICGATPTPTMTPSPTPTMTPEPTPTAAHNVLLPLMFKNR
jgi:uncharacterized repeat protein (TIGR01451 family)